MPANLAVKQFKLTIDKELTSVKLPSIGIIPQRMMWPKGTVFSDLQRMSDTPVTGVSAPQANGFQYRVLIPLMFLIGPGAWGNYMGGSRRASRKNRKVKRSKQSRRN